MIKDQTLESFLDELASTSPTPGAGSAAAISAAMGAALAEMVCRVTLSNVKYKESWETIQASLDNIDTLRQELTDLAEKDINAYQAFTNALHLPRETEEQKQIRKETIQTELRASTEVPLELARKCREFLEQAYLIAAQGAPMAIGDVATAALLADGSLRGSILLAKSNLPMIKDDDYKRQVGLEIERIQIGVELLLQRVILLVESRIG